MQEQFAYITTYIWQTSMSTHWAEVLLFIVVVAQFYCLTACDDLRLADAVRVLARPRRARATRSGARCRAHRVPVWSVFGVGIARRSCCCSRRCWNNLAGYYVGTSVGTTGLYIAFILPVILRLRLGDSFEHGAWSLGNHYKWINPIAIALGRVHLGRVHAPD